MMIGRLALDASLALRVGMTCIPTRSASEASNARERTVPFAIEIEREDDDSWLAEVTDLAGVLAYGQSRKEVVDRVQALALRVLADRLDHGESVPQLDSVFAVTS
jgi:predicted RNase H-like HicB family nuclease